MPLYREVTWPVKVKCKKVVEEGLKSRSSKSKPSPAWDSPIVALCRASWQESMSGYPNLKPAWSAVGSALTSWPKPHPLYSHFSDIFCNVILIFTALSQTSRPWFPFWSSASAAQIFLQLFFSSSAFLLLSFHFSCPSDVSSSQMAVSVTSDIPFRKMRLTFPGVIFIFRPSRKSKVIKSFSSPLFSSC